MFGGSRSVDASTIAWLIEFYPDNQWLCGFSNSMEDILTMYAGYLLAAASAVVTFIQYRLRKKAEVEQIHIRHKLEEKAAQRERRYATYKDYLGRLDNINSSIASNMTGEEMMEETETLMRSITESDDPFNPAAFQRYFAKMNQFMQQWSREQNKALEELNGLRLVCSQSILDLLDDYTATAKTYLDTTTSAMQNFNPLSPRVDEATAAELRRVHGDLQDIRRRIEKQMRQDIGSALVTST